MTSGQTLAIEQLKAICEHSRGLVRLEADPIDQQNLVMCKVSVGCQQIIERRPGGFPLRSREHFTILIADTFPYKVPKILTNHKRWSGMPHVQWTNQLCLYISPETEWNIADGMFGFMERLEQFLVAGARNELDPIGGPLHPPVAYPDADAPLVVIRKDAPKIDGNPWLGLMSLKKVHEHRIELEDWVKIDELGEAETVGAAILLNVAISFEFPTTIGALLTVFEQSGISRDNVFELLGNCAKTLRSGEPLYVAVGTPMRGMAGGNRVQHLAIWRIDNDVAEFFATTLLKDSDSVAIKELVAKFLVSLNAWAQGAKITWCHVSEDRPEIVTRRDFSTPASWFKGKSIAIWGCGALGSHIAEQLVRAGVHRLILVDNKKVMPGILVRQLFQDDDIGKWKAEALASRLKLIRPGLEILPVVKSIDSRIRNGFDYAFSADLVIDATASSSVSVSLEEWLVKGQTLQAPIASVCIGHDATKSMGLFLPMGSPTGIYALNRRAKLNLIKLPDDCGYLDEFWPEQARTDLFQPEPGCSSPTFVGSAADIAVLSGVVVTEIARWLSSENATQQMYTFNSNPAAMLVRSIRKVVPQDHIVEDPDSGFRFFVSEHAWSEIVAWISENKRTFGEHIETGGLLFGERNDLLRVFWIDTAFGPPIDSIRSSIEFVCGTSGTSDLNIHIQRRSRKSSRYVGLWHTHPHGIPKPSSTDISGMNQIGVSTAPSPSWSTMLIVGVLNEEFLVGGYAFEKGSVIPGEYQSHNSWTLIGRGCGTRGTQKVGVALSGGGSRAIAFHLGCLRALHDKGLLPNISALSTVSGGSVAGAYYAYSEGAFEDFEERTITLLREGLARPALGKLITTRLFFFVLLSCLWRIVTWPARILHSGLSKLVPTAPFLLRCEPILYPTRISRTNAIQVMLDSDLFEGKSLSSPTRHNLSLTINACDLTTGTAFRFGNRRVYGWRYGEVNDGDIPVSVAVTASAAFPPFLPALEYKFKFERSGREVSRRIRLTDGGVYDNLGVTAFNSGRLEEHSLGFESPPRIISCDAGEGQFGESGNFNYSSGRILKAFLATFRKTQDHIKANLFDRAKAGEIDSLIYSQLGQQDARLGWAPGQLPPRESVYRYPTNFSAMKEEDIRLLADRGEHLTRLHLERYFD